MSHDDYKEMIPARALSALDAADDRVLTDHLVECAECRRELDDWQATTAGLASRLHHLNLRHSFVNEYWSGPEAPRLKRQVRKSFLSFSQGRMFGAPLDLQVRIAASILFVGMLVYVVLLWKENRALHSQLATLSTENIEARKRLELNAAAMKLISSPGSKMMELGPTPMAPSATAKLPSTRQVTRCSWRRDFRPAPADKEYQLWFIVGNDKMAGKTFTTDGSGNGVLIDQVPAAAMNSAVFAITVEPKGGKHFTNWPDLPGKSFLKSETSHPIIVCRFVSRQ